jgi:hypothetical protein
LALILGAAAPGSALADEVMTYQEERIVNYAYATRLGSGVYNVSGRTVQVYRLPFAWTPRPEAPGRMGVRVKLPLTIGFIDFEPIDVKDKGLPSDLDTVSFVPGIELLLRARENWLLMPYVEAGIAEDRAGDASAYVAAAGVRSVADFTAGRFRLALGNEAAYARVNPREDQPDDAFASFETCLEARHGMGFSIRGREADYGLYATQDLSWSNPSFPLRDTDPASFNDQYEVGVTFGTREPLEVWKIGLPRLGFGYRFANGVSVFRFVIGIPAPSLER